MPGPNFPYTHLDHQQVLKQSFDETKDRLRVDAQVSATISSIEISALDSDIAIKDRITGYLLKINSDGSIDTNVVLDAASDSVSIADATTGYKLKVNVDGSSDVNLNGLNNFKTTQYTVGTSAVQLTPSPLANRSSVSIKVKSNLTGDVCYIGPTSGVTTSTGYALFNGDSIQLDLTATNSIWIISNNPSQKVYVLELGK